MQRIHHASWMSFTSLQPVASNCPQKTEDFPCLPNLVPAQAFCPPDDTPVPASSTAHSSDPQPRPRPPNLTPDPDPDPNPGPQTLSPPCPQEALVTQVQENLLLRLMAPGSSRSQSKHLVNRSARSFVRKGAAAGAAGGGGWGDDAARTAPSSPRCAAAWSCMTS